MSETLRPVCTSRFRVPASFHLSFAAIWFHYIITSIVHRLLFVADNKV